MKFGDLDRTMRVFETAHDHCVLPGIHIVVRLDGRSFTHLTRERHPFEHPFDPRFRDYMVATTEHLMACGFRVIYGYTQSDEISLLLHPREEVFGRKLRKLISVLAGEASAKFSLLLGDLAAFDGRVSQLPGDSHVVDYFRWRQEDAARNALNGHCYWMLVDGGLSPREAARRLAGMSVSRKNELLFSHGINFAHLPAWQKRGAGLWWEVVTRPGRDPRTGEETTATRRQVIRDLDLPIGDAYSGLIAGLLRAAEAEE
jgi:tRNA(His) guanylyltransferase